MKYNYKEYEHIFDTLAKREQESVVANKIMDLLNKNKYDSIVEFNNKNQTYQDFLKNNELNNVVKHFGNTLNEEDFIRIKNEMVKLTDKKRSFDKENIQTTNIDNKEYNSYKGDEKNYYFDNSNSSMSLERQMEELQKTEEKFQTSDTKQNTENMMEELENNKKESLNLKYLNEIDVANLNERQKEIFKTIANYQLDISKIVKVDIDKEVIVDENNNIMKIEKKDNQYLILGDNNQIKESTELEKEPKTFQKTLTPSTLYTNNN